MNFSRFITPKSAARLESPIRKTTAIALQNPDILSLASGMPNAKLFPFKSFDIVTQSGEKIALNGKDMGSALQYSASQGTQDMINWIRKLHKTFHDPPLMVRTIEQGGFNTCVTPGSQDGLIKVFEMLVQPGDNVVLDDPCYAGTLAMLRPMGCKLLPIETDKHGMISESLLDLMQRWTPDDAKDPNSKIPKVLYTIPNGGNPTGATATLKRKQEIYKIAQMYDMVIIEDDPYFFLTYEKLTPSYQSLDVDGRVIRSDSMSKVMSSGLRVGWISGANSFIQRLILHQQVSTLHTSTLIQMMLSKLLDQWGIEGFRNHVEQIQTFYKQQRDICIQYADKWLKGLAEWNEPEGGMFLWMKLIGIEDTTKLIQEKAMEKKVLLLPGSVFNVEEGKASSYCRVSFSFASDEKMDEAFRRLAALLEEERAKN
uniref:Kynurenine/alpha-aminoadipate aminotransferase, mitochondrial n=1 Tax=Phallusia mammillata TaxID=59560 RepID=A0A6F9D4U5_9ASCI|nr:kynurenine/alpha-aminoadipate aminotransferase, mitochondrial-like [Phallusia mammillata]